MDPISSVLSSLESDASIETAQAFARLVVDYLAATRTSEGRVSTGLSPSELARRFDEPLPAGGHPIDEILARLERDVLPDCNRLTHPRSMGHQVSAPVPVAVWTEALTAALNQSGAVWEMSPVGTVIEARVIRWMCDLAGLGPAAGGTFTSGGTEATFAGLLAARQAALPDAWKRGVGGRPPVVVCGEHSHYGVARAIGELGIGTDNAVIVPSADFRMDVAALGRHLDRLRAESRAVMAVVATAGTTATGSFDDIDAIGRLCEARDLWLHVDGAHGASALFSPSHRHRLSGIERARSIAWDPHKMMLMPLTASVVLVRDEQDLEAAFSQRAPYLFHAREGERNWDQGLRSFTCSRRIDALKVWVGLQRYGAAGLGALYDHLCGNARALHDAVAARRDFATPHVPESNILCFRYVGDGSLNDEQLDVLNLRLREEYNRKGTGWITTTMLAGRRVLRATLMNPRTTRRDLHDMVEEVGVMAEELR
ncbi:MAG TPA: pyridoxal-dependent decarboxylase [Vicinamibacterales bacterium]|jgi:L-2,4-diaminobutyrate decarboxylase